MRERIMESPLCDSSCFARSVEDVCGKIWKRRFLERGNMQDVPQCAAINFSVPVTLMGSYLAF